MLSEDEQSVSSKKDNLNTKKRGVEGSPGEGPQRKKTKSNVSRSKDPCVATEEEEKHEIKPEEEYNPIIASQKESLENEKCEENVIEVGDEVQIQAMLSQVKWEKHLKLFTLYLVVKLGQLVLTIGVTPISQTSTQNADF